MELDIKPTDEDAVLREVWNIEDIEAKTELTSEQIEKTNKALTLADLTHSRLIRTHIKRFMILQKSKDRKSMNEFIEAIKEKKHEIAERGRGFMSGMMG